MFATRFRAVKPLFPNALRYSTESGPIILEKLQNQHQGIFVLGFNSPTNKNAFSLNVAAELNKALDEVQLNKNVRVLLVRSFVPGVFCAGADLKERAKMRVERVLATVSDLRGLMARFYKLSVPVVAAIDGVALGGGFELSLSCDIRVASSDAKLGLVETRLAIIPGAGGTQYLPRIINPSIAKELIFTAKVLNATEAKELGVVNHIAEQNESKNAAYLKALQIAEAILPNGPLGVKMAKRAINKGLEVDLDTGFSVEEACYAQLLHTKDRVEGLTAFGEKRKPNYKGE